MAKLAVLSGKEVCKILARHGFAEARKRGSDEEIGHDCANDDGDGQLPIAFRLLNCADGAVDR